jgi:2-methylcitrate synthase
LPTDLELKALKKKLAKYRSLPDSLKNILKATPKETNSMDVARTICSLLSIFYPENKDFSNQSEIPLVAMGTLTSALNYWYHWAFNGKEIDVNSTDSESIAHHFLRLLY